MERERLDNWCERGILGLVLAILVFAPLATGAVREVDFLVVQILTVGVLALWLARFWLREGHRILWPPISWAVTGFMGYAIARYWFAPVEFLAREELIKVLVYGFLFLAILDNLARQEHTRLIVFVLVFLGMAISLYAVFQFLTGSEYVWHFRKPPDYAGRASGSYICPNHLAGFLEMVLPLGLAFTLAGRLNLTLKVFLGYASLAIVAGIVVSFSRGGWLATGLALALFFGFLVRRRETRWPALVFFGLLLGSVFLFFKENHQPKERIERIFVEGRIQDARFRLWKPAWEIWRDNVWFGVGPAHFDYTFRGYRPDDVQMRPNRVHNDYLNTLVDWGVAGAFWVLAAWALFWWGMIKSWKFVRRGNDLGNKPSNRAAFILGGAAGLFAILIHSALDFNMHIPANALVAVTLMALLSGYLRYATERFWFNPGQVGRVAASAILLAGLFYLGQQSLNRGRELRRLGHAQRVLPENREAALAALKRAHEIEPRNFATVYRIGEILRLEARDSYLVQRELAEESLIWYQRGMELNPLDPYPPLRYGMSLHLLGRHEEARAYFQRALELDPNHYSILAHVGWHHFQLREYEAAKDWFERSIVLSYWRLDRIYDPENWHHNPEAEMYLGLIEREIGKERLWKP